MDQACFAAYAQIVQQAFGIQLPPEKKALLESRLFKLFQHEDERLPASCRTATGFLTWLRKDNDGSRAETPLRGDHDASYVFPARRGPFLVFPRRRPAVDRAGSGAHAGRADVVRSLLDRRGGIYARDAPDGVFLPARRGLGDLPARDGPLRGGHRAGGATGSGRPWRRYGRASSFARSTS